MMLMNDLGDQKADKSSNILSFLNATDDMSMVF